MNFNKDLSQILEKYKFNNNSLKQLLSDVGNKLYDKAQEAAQKAKELAEKQESLNVRKKDLM